MGINFDSIGSRGRRRFAVIIVVVCICSVFGLDFLHKRTDYTVPKPVFLRHNSANGSNSTETRGQLLQQHGPDSSGEIRRVVFLKTHKTGSTTASSIFQRFGIKRNLTFLVPDKTHILSLVDLFDSRQIGQPTSTSWNFSIGYQMLTNHVRYNRAEMDKVFHQTSYVTIIRNPVDQFESGFYYFEMWKVLPKSDKPLDLFMSNPKKCYRYVQQKHPRKEYPLHNMQLFDLGMNPMDMGNQEKINRKVKQLDKDFTLVMINEYFDESLVLLRKLLRWSMEDITYTSRCVRSQKYRGNMSAEQRSQIHQWNGGDAKLYQYFNRTFWEKVRNYDGDFEQDLAIFRQHQERVAACLNRSKTNSKNDQRTIVYGLVNDAPKWCYDYRFSDVAVSEATRNRMRTLGIPLYRTGHIEAPKSSRKKIVSMRHKSLNTST